MRHQVFKIFTLACALAIGGCTSTTRPELSGSDLEQIKTFSTNPNGARIYMALGSHSVESITGKATSDTMSANVYVDDKEIAEIRSGDEYIAIDLREGQHKINWSPRNIIDQLNTQEIPLEIDFSKNQNYYFALEMYQGGDYRPGYAGVVNYAKKKVAVSYLSGSDALKGKFLVFYRRID